MCHNSVDWLGSSFIGLTWGPSWVCCEVAARAASSLLCVSVYTFPRCIPPFSIEEALCTRHYSRWWDRLLNKTYKGETLMELTFLNSYIANNEQVNLYIIRWSGWVGGYFAVVQAALFRHDIWRSGGKHLLVWISRARKNPGGRDY